MHSNNKQHNNSTRNIKHISNISNIAHHNKPMQILTFANRKGGVAKTTSAWAVANCLAHSGRKVLLVDCDPQMNLTQSLPTTNPSQSLTQVIDGGGSSLVELMQPVGENLWLVPAAPTLAAAEKVLGADPMYALVLRNALEGLPERIDYVVFDTSPSPNSPLALAALTAADRVFIPSSPEFFAFNGLQSLLELVERIRKNFAPGLEVGGLFLTKYAASYRRSLHHQFVETMKQNPSLGKLLMRTTIRENVAVAEAQVQKQSLYDWAPTCAALQDYEALTNEIVATLPR
jgi:chromosome partitioning protein